MKNYFITGGTGSFGQAFLKSFLNKKNTNVFIYSRDEMKHWYLQQDLFKNAKNFNYILGDVRDKDKLIYSTKNIDYLIHAAATKIVPTAESNPTECINTNIFGAMNVVEASKVNKIKKIVALSTDKACNPINLYGASKLASDKLFISANYDSITSFSKFSVVRYGNVIGSRGSIVPFFKKLNSENSRYFPITHKDMTRFVITLDEAVKMVQFALRNSLGGEIYIKKLPSIRIIDLAKAVNEKKKIKLIGIRPGEKLHEAMISQDDSLNTFEYNDHYKILSPLIDKKIKGKIIAKSKKVKANFSYSSQKNNSWLSIQQIKKIIG